MLVMLVDQVVLAAEQALEDQVHLDKVMLVALAQEHLIIHQEAEAVLEVLEQTVLELHLEMVAQEQYQVLLEAQQLMLRALAVLAVDYMVQMQEQVLLVQEPHQEEVETVVQLLPTQALAVAVVLLMVELAVQE